MPEAYAQIYKATNDYPDIRFILMLKLIFNRSENNKFQIRQEDL